MSAGSGIRHSEFNPSQRDQVHFLQIWIQPSAFGITPSYEEKPFADSEKRGRLRVIASPDAAEGSVRIRRDARVYAGLFGGEENAALSIAPPSCCLPSWARGIPGGCLSLAKIVEVQRIHILSHPGDLPFANFDHEVIAVTVAPAVVPGSVRFDFDGDAIPFGGNPLDQDLHAARDRSGNAMQQTLRLGAVLET